MTQKVVILTAGVGSRLNQRTQYFNKALLRVGDQAVISHIMGLFSAETNFVIALGHLGHIVKQYLTLAHPEANFTFVEIDKYSVPGTGPGYALKQCEPHLQQPFFFCACDTLVTPESFWKHPMEGKNTVVYDRIDRKNAEQYCTVKLDRNGHALLCDKSKEGTDLAFTGLAHIEDWQIFWQSMHHNNDLIKKEIQLSPALSSLPKLHAVPMDWFDVGNEQGLLRARESFKGIQNLDKLDEELYVVNNKVIKYFYNQHVIRLRLKRAEKMTGLVPEIVGASPNFYKYNFVYGDDLFEKYENLPEILPGLLEHAKQNLWTDIKPNPKIFHHACLYFYKDKTFQRIEKFRNLTGITDKEECINGYVSRPLSYYLGKIYWNDLCDGIPSGFHGDFQPGNIVMDMAKKFTFIDWRQDFGDLTSCGDRYYDFAKFYASLLMPHPSIKSNKYKLTQSRGEIFTSIYVPPEIRDARNVFENWLYDNKYSLTRVSLLAAIVMLNMAPLHEHPLDQWLYYYAKDLLGQLLTGENDE